MTAEQVLYIYRFIDTLGLMMSSVRFPKEPGPVVVGIQVNGIHRLDLGLGHWIDFCDEGVANWHPAIGGLVQDVLETIASPYCLWDHPIEY